MAAGRSKQHRNAGGWGRQQSQDGEPCFLFKKGVCRHAGQRFGQRRISRQIQKR